MRCEYNAQFNKRARQIVGYGASEPAAAQLERNFQGETLHVPSSGKLHIVYHQLEYTKAQHTSRIPNMFRYFRDTHTHIHSESVGHPRVCEDMRPDCDKIKPHNKHTRSRHQHGCALSSHTHTHSHMCETCHSDAKRTTCECMETLQMHPCRSIASARCIYMCACACVPDAAAWPAISKRGACSHVSAPVRACVHFRTGKTFCFRLGTSWGSHNLEAHTHTHTWQAVVPPHYLCTNIHIRTIKCQV